MLSEVAVRKCHLYHMSPVPVASLFQLPSPVLFSEQVPVGQARGKESQIWVRTLLAALKLALVVKLRSVPCLVFCSPSGSGA